MARVVDYWLAERVSIFAAYQSKNKREFIMRRVRSLMSLIGDANQSQQNQHRAWLEREVLKGTLPPTTVFLHPRADARSGGREGGGR